MPAATALYGAMTDLGFIVGPALAALLLLFGGPELVLCINAGTFAVSALRPEPPALRGGSRAATRRRMLAPGLFREAREGSGSSLAWLGIRAVIIGSGAMLLFAGLFNVAELPFATDELGRRQRRLLGAGRDLRARVRRGVAVRGSRRRRPSCSGAASSAASQLVGAGFIACGVAPGFGVAIPAFALAGLGNGILLVYERLLIQTTVDDA